MNRLSAAFEHMSNVQSLSYSVVRDENGAVISVSRQPRKLNEQPLKVKVLDS